MKRTGFIIYGILLTAFFNSCNKPGCLGSAGAVNATTLSLTSFNQVVLNNNINLILTQGTEEKMVIEAPKNIIPGIIGKIEENILTISNSNECRWARDPDEKITVHLYFKTLTDILYNGSGNITNTDTLRLDHLQFETSEGAGSISLTVDNHYTGSYILQESADITWHGKSDVCFTYTNSRGNADMSDFIVKKMVIEYGGLGDTHVNVTEDLDVIIFYKGNIYYKGTPVISRAVYYSTGKLLHTP
jgi:hypothetical protein